MAYVPWRVAVARALYGERGFYRRVEGPAGHFRTSAHASPLFAAALARLARTCRLGGVVDLGAGRGELLRALHAHAPDLRLLGVDVVGRPGGLPAAVDWADELPERLDGLLLVANEWLDTVPCDAVVVAADGTWRLLLVDPATGAERRGPPPDGAAGAWLDTWWPAAARGDRAEVGRPRDEAWADVVRRLRGGVAVAVDYGHDRAARVAGAHAAGTLAGYRAGRAVVPVPDGSCDVTAHVALDACAAAGEAAGATATRRTIQRAALRSLGVDGDRPDAALARTDPRGYLGALARASEAAELTAAGGLGGFGWLVQAVGVDLPELGVDLPELGVDRPELSAPSPAGTAARG